MNHVKCIRCHKSLPSNYVYCFKCNKPYCSRECQVKNVQRHKYYCNVKPSEFVGKIIEEIEPKLRSYCYLMRRFGNIDPLGNIYIQNARNLADETKKTFGVKFGKIPDDVNKLIPKSKSEYTIYLNTGDYRGYFRYPLEGLTKLDEFNKDDLPNELYINTHQRRMYYK